MPHGARKKSESGYYHVVPKGIGDQLIFADDDDRNRYLRLLIEAKKSFGLRIHAYCLMSNHTHLVLEDERGVLSNAMKYIDERYGKYYAEKIARSGGVFRRPFWSEPIEDENRLLCAVRYAHNNPAAAGLCRASQYAWSSVGDYLGRTKTDITTTDLTLDLLGGREGFIAFSSAENATAHPFEGSRLRAHLGDDEAIRLAASILGHDPRTRTTIEEVRILKNRGFPIAQLSRITGMGKGIIGHA